LVDWGGVGGQRGLTFPTIQYPEKEEPMGNRSKIIELVKANEEALRQDWVKEQLSAITLRADLLSEQDLRQQSREFLQLFRRALESGITTDIQAPPWAQALTFLEDVSRSMAEKGFSPSETATFIFSLK
jgi:rsbT co-antagonist protein RsbR